MPRVVLLLAALVMLLVVGGCLSGTNLSGGSIPIGGDINGRLAQEAGATASLASVTVELVDENGTVVASTLTGDQGQFTFKDVKKGDWRIRVRRESKVSELEVYLGSNDPVEVSVFLHENQPAVQHIALRPAGPNLTLRVGEIQQFQAVGLPASPASAALDVSWTVHGNAGAITPGGLFTAVRAGKSVIIATYGEQTAFVNITVVAPPPPPGPDTDATGGN